MASQAGLVFYVLASGFVAAGLLNALYQSLAGDDRQETGPFLVLRFDTPIMIAWSMIVCVFAGPYLVIRNGYQFWRLDVLPTPALFVCAIISAIWSFCSGVVIVETVLAVSTL